MSKDLGNRVVYKFKIDLARATNGGFPLTLPKFSRLLDADEQHGELVLWALVDPSAPQGTETKTVRLRMTGQVFPFEHIVDSYHLSTVKMQSGIVAHLFVEAGA